MGYPEEFGLSNGTNAAAGGGSEACVPFTVTIVADNWPKEISWVVKNIDMNETVAEGDNENLLPGEPVEYNECLKSKMGCYEFTINGEIFVDVAACMYCYLINSDFIR